MNWPPDTHEIPVKRRHSFPGLGAGDAQVLRHALESGRLKPERMWLNVPVGDPPAWTLDPRFAPYARRMASIYQRRIDAVVQHGNALRIIELKPLGSPTAVGQALLYRLLAENTPELIGEPSACILCDALQPNIRSLTRAYGIHACELSIPDQPVLPEGMT